MADRRKSPAPKSMGTRGLRFWKHVTGKYELRADELVVLEDACREMKMIDHLESALVGADVMVKGSQGQPAINPIIPELRQHRATLKSLLGSLKLPDDVESAAGVDEPRSVQAREAAKSRWSVAYGEAAG